MTDGKAVAPAPIGSARSSSAGSARSSSAGAAGASPALLLRHATLESGEVADVLLGGGQIEAVGPEASRHPSAARAPAHDLTGYLLLPSAAEAHAHLDKALLADRCPNETGDLTGAITAVRRAYTTMDEADIVRRAHAALRIALGHGYTAVRTHVNCEPGLGTRALRALCYLRQELAAEVEIQLVAHMGMPITGPEGAAQRTLIDEAASHGADMVGGAPALDPRPVEAMRLLVGAAAAAGLGADLHLDETTDARVLILGEYAAEVTRRGLSGRATASHCVSLGQQTSSQARIVASRLAGAGIGVVTLPQTNLFLQARDQPTRAVRGLTSVGILRQAGVTVAAGGDNWRDPFNPLGRIDPFETASLMVAAAHFSPYDAYAAVSDEARQVMGLPKVAVQPGFPADLLAVRATNVAEAVAAASEDRWVFRAGALVARARVLRDI